MRARTTALVAIAIEDAADFFTVGAGVVAVDGDLTSSDELLAAADPELVLFDELVEVAVLVVLLLAPTVAVLVVLPEVLPVAVTVLVTVVEPEALAQAVWIGLIRSVSSFMPISVQSPRPRPLTAVSTLLHAALAQSLGKFSAVGVVSAVNEKPDSDVQVAIFGSESSGESLVTSQSTALAAAIEAARVSRESFMVAEKEAVRLLLAWVLGGEKESESVGGRCSRLKRAETFAGVVLTSSIK